MKDEISYTPFYSSFIALCERDGIKPTKAAEKAGIASGTPTAWKKKGSIPRPEQLKRLCELFDVSESELLGYSAKKESPPPIRSGLTDPLDIRLMEEIPGLTPDQKELLLAQIQVLKEKK